MNGVININKPEGITSQQVVNKVKKILHCKKVGHLGTLDPAGAGVLPITLGRATKLFDYFSEKIKKYRAIFVFGKETDTLDSTGYVINQSNNIPNIEQIRQACLTMIGDIEQLPPKFSAKHINGVRAYELARENIEFEIKTKKITIYSVDVISQISSNSFLFEIACSTGTYIRSICRDLAYKLNTYAYMPLIIRTAMGKFNLNTSVSYSEFINSDEPNKYVLNLNQILDNDILHLDLDEVTKIKNGMTLIKNLPDNRYLIVENNKVVAIAKSVKNRLKMEIYLDD